MAPTTSMPMPAPLDMLCPSVLRPSSSSLRTVRVRVVMPI
jgi:hypothetical protein